MKSKFFSVISLVSVFALALVGYSSAAVIGNVTISGSPNFVAGANLSISGSCGTEGIIPEILFDPVAITVTQNGNVTALGTVTLDSNASFQTTVSLPSGFSSAPAVLTAICPDGDTLVTQLPATVPIGTSLAIDGNASLGNTITVSGTCGTIPAGSTVTFSLIRAGVSTSLGSTTTVGAGGNFSAALNLGASLGAGPATLVASCPGGNTIAASLVVGPVVTDPSVTDPSLTLIVTNNNPALGNELRFSGVCGITAGTNVQIALVRGSTITVIGNVVTSTDGVFSATLTIPDTFGLGPATLQASGACGLLSAAITVTPDGATPSTPPATDGSTDGTGGSTDDPGTVAVSDESALSDDSTPEGGVAAGSGTANVVGWLLMALALGSAVYAYNYSVKPSLN